MIQIMKFIETATREEKGQILIQIMDTTNLRIFNPKNENTYLIDMVCAPPGEIHLILGKKVKYGDNQ